jgi:hypothetical protein
VPNKLNKLKVAPMMKAHTECLACGFKRKLKTCYFDLTIFHAKIFGNIDHAVGLKLSRPKTSDSDQLISIINQIALNDDLIK